MYGSGTREFPAGPRGLPLLKPLNLPRLGNPGRAAPILTKTLLFIGGGDPIMVRAQRIPPGMPASIVPGAGDTTFKAYDKATGDLVWNFTMPAGTTGAPISYLFGGKQYIVVAIGGVKHPAEYVAFSLP